MKQLLLASFLIFSIRAMDNQHEKKIHSIRYGKISVSYIQKNNLIKIIGSQECLKKIEHAKNSKSNTGDTKTQFAHEIAQACADACIECSLS